MQKGTTTRLTKLIPASQAEAQLQSESFNISKISSLQISANRLLNWLLSQQSAYLNDQPEYVIDMFRRQIISSINIYPQVTGTVTLKLEGYKAPRSKKYSAVRNLSRDIAKLSDSLTAALVFSSVATGDIVENWSDLDVLVVIKDEVITDESRFLKFRKSAQVLESHLYRFDLYQHHGIQYIAESDLKFYPESFLPLVTIKLGKSLLGNQALLFNVRDSYADQVAHFYSQRDLFKQAATSGQLKHHGRQGVYLHNNFELAADNFYQLKYFVSVILLLPSLFIGLIDKPIYKRESFSVIKKYFSADELELVRACENVRLYFAEHKPRGNAIPAAIKPILGNKYFERSVNLIETLIQEYERS